MVGENDSIAVWFSCGAASAVALKLTVERYGVCNVRALNNFVAEEDEDNRRFMRDVSDWVGVEIEDVKNPDFPEGSAAEVWDSRKFMSGPKGAPCTTLLKKAARQIWSRDNEVDWHVFGFTADENHRFEQFVSSEMENVIPVLGLADMTKQDCFDMVTAAGIELPRIYGWGYPNANCIGCVKATSPTYWNLVRKTHPHVFESRAEQSREVGARLVRHKGERIFLDELPADAKGNSLKQYRVECGVTCEERGPVLRENGIGPLENWKIRELV